MQVEFQSSTANDLPGSELLKTHCAIAKYLHASGMGKQVDKMLAREEKNDPEPINLEYIYICVRYRELKRDHRLTVVE